MKIWRTSCIGLMMIFLSGCVAIHSGYMTDSAALSSANFYYVKHNISGKSTATYILGIGGLGKETLINDTKQEMLDINPLSANQALVNLTVNFKSSYYFAYLYHTVTCTITADVVQFKSANSLEDDDTGSANQNQPVADCASVKDGTFTMGGQTIVRQGDTQTTIGMGGKQTKYKVEWMEDCKYQLSRVDDDKKQMMVIITKVDTKGYNCNVDYGSYSRYERLNRVK